MKLTKSLAAIVAATALVIMAATPASATTRGLEVTSGILTNTVLGTFTLGPGGTPTPPCTQYSTDTDMIVINDNGIGGTSNSAVSSTTSFMFGTPSAPYIVTITLHTGSNVGTVDLTTTTPRIYTNLSVRVSFAKAVLTSGNPSTCVGDTTVTPNPVCTVKVNFDATTPATQLVGAITGYPFNVSTTALLTGKGLVAGIFPLPCNAPFATLISTTITLSSLGIHVIY